MSNTYAWNQADAAAGSLSGSLLFSSDLNHRTDDLQEQAKCHRMRDAIGWSLQEASHTIDGSVFTHLMPNTSHCKCSEFYSEATKFFNFPTRIRYQVRPVRNAVTSGTTQLISLAVPEELLTAGVALPLPHFTLQPESENCFSESAKQ